MYVFVCLYVCIMYVCICVYICVLFEPGGADKSLARPRRKQATANKLGVYSTYSSRSSIHYLARCSKISSHSRKIRSLSVQPGLRGSNDLRVGLKMATFQLLFQSREHVVDRRGHIRRLGWLVKTLEAQVGQFLQGFKCQVSRGIVVQEQEPLAELTAAFSLHNVLQLHQERWKILLVYSFPMDDND